MSQNSLREGGKPFKKVRISADTGLQEIHLENILETLQTKGVYILQVIDNEESVLQPIPPPQQETGAGKAKEPRSPAGDTSFTDIFKDLFPHL